MKYLLPLIIALACYYNVSASVYNELCNVNKLWRENDITNLDLPKEEPRTAQEWIQLHLSLVESKLRSKNISGLSASQKANRSIALDHLHQYWLAGRFPQNTEYSYKTPIFIDKFDNFCAVGYLVKATGYEDVSRMISSKSNLSYVRDMNYKELEDWTNEYGFTKDELAWIQPMYGPMCTLSSVDGGTNGSVKELFVDDANNTLYVGGDFNVVGGTLAAGHIAYVTPSSAGYIWNTLGVGVNGTVTAISTFNNEVYAAGNFTLAGSIPASGIAKWDGSVWASAGCLHGDIKELIEFDGNLYATGNFTICSDGSAANFAKWNSTDWVAIPGLAGVVNTAEVIGTDLFLGGNFNYNGNNVNAIKWNSLSGFIAFNNPIVNEVNDFESFQGDVYAACKFTSGTDSTLLVKLSANTWDSVMNMQGLNYSGQWSLNAISAVNNSFITGGDFKSRRFITPPVKNSISVYDQSFENWFIADSIVNKMVAFNGKIIAGGDFSSHIGERNPMMILNSNSYASYTCKGNNGKVFASAWGGIQPYQYQWTDLSTNFTWMDDGLIENLAPGNYSVIVTDDEGKKVTNTVRVISVDINDTLQFDPINKYLRVKGITIPAEYTWMDCIADTVVSSKVYYDVTHDGDYYCIVDQNGCIDTTDCISIRLTPDNVSHIVTNTGIKIFPNPAYDVLNITTATGIQTISIADITGRVVLRQALNGSREVQLNMSSFSSGYYTVILTTADGSSTQHKLIKE